jgi:hypothetical protein
MHADTWVALIAVVIAVVVPWMTFRLALRQDHVRWIREQRSQLYIDMLTEAHAEYDWLELESAGKEAQERAREWFTDKRLLPLERARLGARGTIFGSQAVNRAFNQIGTKAFWLLHAPGDPDAVQMRVRVELGAIIDELEKTVRRELGTDRVPLNGGPDTGGSPGERWKAGPGMMPPFDEEDESTAEAP